ncbi:hypothetical protein [Vibrio barjaei]|uniref:hypothetical protein n=1 Tax=Vibrio barjaei TaxID=1676683 RepID=UPI0022838C4A|nr:hypothetical protein [Vibrio barjaei]MCY9870416.1 hypothetical protein [Vibrio barjaei]
MKTSETINTILYKGIKGGIKQESDLKKLRSVEGTFGSGYYFSNESVATDWGIGDEGVHLLVAHVSSSNPLVVKGDYEMGLQHGLETPALPLLEKIFPKDDIILLLNRRDWCYLGEEVEERVKEAGYDSIVVLYDKAFETIVYDEENILVHEYRLKFV